MAYPLFVALVWHMHQPYYRDTVTGQYRLPWTRLHATKDYLHMVKVLADFPSVHQTFNLVPCLLEQLEDYAHHQAVDQYLSLSLKPDLTVEDKQFLLNNFFNTNWEKVIARHPRYWQLLQIRNQVNGDVSLLSDQYWRDLAAWFNLAWIDPGLLRSDDLLKELVSKGEGFSHDDITAIIGKHREICAAVIPAYRQAQDAGQIEISTSPYYHPILPLLIDTRAALQASPQLGLPQPGFAHPEDAVEQLRRGVSLYSHYFGRAPRGLWPSEGSVCQETITLLQERHLVDWLASDEGVLGRSTSSWFERDGYGHLLNPRPICQPYRLGPDGPNIVFRDHVLSDRIGFVYQQMDSRQAAEDLVHRLHRIHDSVATDHQPYLVSIILDGENCWEQYENNGDDFLRHLYQMIADDASLRAVTVSEYLDQFPPRSELSSIVAGSWIASNLETWIGEPEQNRAWAYLERTRDRLMAWQLDDSLADMATLESAWQEIYIAEGSDWFWWYYSHNKYGHEHVFDEEFRTHLGNVYLTMGLPIPLWLKQPIQGPSAVTSAGVSAYISPRLSIADTASTEWAGAGYVEPQLAGAAMQRSSSLLRRFYFGYNPSTLFLRLEANESLSPYFVGFYLSAPSRDRSNELTRFGGRNALASSTGFPMNYEIAIEQGQGMPTLSEAAGNNTWRAVQGLTKSAIGRQTIELAVGFGDIGLQIGDTVGILAVIARDGMEMETLPSAGFVSFTLTLRG